MFSDSTSFKNMGSYSEKPFQLINGISNSIPILACYVAQNIPADEFNRFLAIASPFLQGRGILAGDFNARHGAWDDGNNRHGTKLHSWAQRHNFRTPATPPHVSNRSSHPCRYLT